MIDQAHRLRDIVKAKNEHDAEAVVKKISTRVIGITSGKGGVGKTNFAINLAIQLSRYNKRVVIIDADFGLANIEVLFGLIPKYTFADVLISNKSIQEVITEGPMGVKFISGGSGLVEMANLTERQITSVIDNFQYLDKIADIILVDTGAGISRTVVNFIKAASETIIVTTPEPTAVTDAYAIIKAAKESKVEAPKFSVVVNRVDDMREGYEIYEKLRKVSERFLGIPLSCLGYIPNDIHLSKAVKKQEPVSICYPNAESTRAIDNIGIKLLNLPVENKSLQDGMMSFMKRLVNAFHN